MKQAIHIFKKDVRYLRYDIAITLLAAVALCFLKNPLILPVTWWFMIARVIHAEAIPGSRQFWLTRPYAWRSLLGAKLLFIFMFVNLPLLIADAAIVSWAGFPIGQNLAGLLWTQLLLIAAFVLPAAALSAITSGLVETLTVTLLLLFGFLLRILANPFIGSGVSWMELEWLKTYCLIAQLAIVATIILIWQYARRNTSGTRIMAGATATVLLFGSTFIPWRAAFEMQTHLSKRQINSSAMRISLDTERKWLGRVYAAEQDEMIAELPLQISGVPSDMKLKPNGIEVTLHALGGESSNAEQAPSSFDFEAGITSLRVAIRKPFYDKVKSQSLTLRGTLFFTLYDNKRSTPVPLNTRRVPIQGVGICSASPQVLICDSAFWPQSDSVRIRLVEDSSGRSRIKSEKLNTIASYSPFPADLNVYPIHRFLSPRSNPMSEVRIESSEPVAHLERGFEIDNVRLGDFAEQR